MNYFEKYLKRRNVDSPQNSREAAQKSRRREFTRWFAQSPTRETLTTTDGVEFQGSVQSNKFSDSKSIKYLVLPHDVSFPLGTLIKRGEEIWIIYTHEPHTLEIDNRYVMYECKHVLKWVTENGSVIETPCLIVGPLESDLKEAFRTWNKVIAPQTNIVLNIIMPNLSLKRETRVIIGNEAWHVSESDNYTKEGISFVTLEESRKKSADENQENLADIERLGRVEIVARNFPVYVRSNTLSTINAWVEIDGTMVENKLEFLALTPNIEVIGNKIKAKTAGSHKVLATYKDDPRITKELGFVVSPVEQVTKYEIEGPEILYWGEKATYEVVRYVNTIAIPETATFTVDRDFLETAEKDGKLIITVPDYGKSGIVTITGTANGKTATKKITIKTVWG